MGRADIPVGHQNTPEKKMTFCRLFTSILGLLIVGASIPAPAPAAPGDDPVFSAMQDELDRSTRQLEIEDMGHPYFLAYRVEDSETAQIVARYGAVVRSQKGVGRRLSIQLRVGSPEFDNTNFISSWDDISDYERGLMEEDDYR
jgi:hypothetical protein